MLDRAVIAGDLEVGRGVPLRHDVAKGQHIGAGAAGVLRGFPVVEGKRRRAGNGDWFAGVERDGEGMIDTDIGLAVVVCGRQRCFRWRQRITGTSLMPVPDW